MADILLTTILHRPYVMGFLMAYLVISWHIAGARFCGLHLFTGYWIAFASEYLSINYGLPYGWYHYIYENLQGEWLNHGVPVWDSASYVFMCFAGLVTARVVWRDRPLKTWQQRLSLVLLSSFFVTLLDIVTDPVAHMGERWFLGKIYFYPQPGWYFDITMANFIGWLIVSFTINMAAEFIWRFSHCAKIRGAFDLHRRRSTWMSLGLYYGIFAFSSSIAVYLMEWKLVGCNALWFLLSLIVIRLNQIKQFTARVT
jgi:putative membrane protein